MRKKRAVKEGSPFEESYLLDVLKEGTICDPNDKQVVKDLMQIMVMFGLVTEAVTIHSLIAKVISASLQASLLMSVEQERVLQRIPEIMGDGGFSKELGRTERETKVKKELTDWENVKCFKH
jgi:hypothetical protein